jgi:hypothetical protein
MIHTIAPDSFHSIEQVTMGSRDVEEIEEMRFVSTPSPPHHPPPIPDTVFHRSQSQSSVSIADYYPHETMSFHVASFCLRFQIGSAYCEMPPQASWEHPITDQYAQSHMYYSQQAPNANQSWQMPQGSLPPDAPYYGFYLPGYPPFPPHGSSEFMYPVHGSHGHNSMDHNQYLSYHESAVPLGSRGRHNRKKMIKKRGKETKNLRTMALPEDSHESRSLLSIKGKVLVCFPVCKRCVFFNRVDPPLRVTVPFRMCCQIFQGTGWFSVHPAAPRCC